MAISCPNKALKKWKDLVDFVGENKAYALWAEYEGNVPNIYYADNENLQKLGQEVSFSESNDIMSFAKSNEFDVTETFVEKKGDKTYSFLFNKTSDYGITINNQVLNPSEMSRLGINPAKGLAFYDVKTNQINLTDNFLKLTKYDQTRILAHESIHGLIRNKLNQMDDLNKEVIKDSFDKFINKVKSNSNLQKYSSVKRVMNIVDRDGYEELITYGLTDPEFAAALNGEVLGVQDEDSKATFWQKLKELILSVISDDYTLFDEFMDLLDAHFEITEQKESGLYELGTNNKVDLNVDKYAQQDYDRLLAESEEEPTSIHQKIVEEDINTKKKLFKDVEDKLKNLLNGVGISYENISELKDYEGNDIDAISKADIVNKIIQVIEEKRDITTLPKEAARVFVKLLGEDSDTYKSMMEKIPRFKIYDEVKSEYGNEYDSEKQIREEAIDKLIARQILSEEGEIDDTALNKDLFNKWWNRLWNATQSVLGGIKSSEMSPFIKSAKMILNREVDRLLSLDKVIELNQDDLKGLVYYQLSNQAINRKNRMISDFEMNKQSFNQKNNRLETADGKEIKFRFNDAKEIYYIHKNYKITNNEKREMVSLKGMYIDALNAEFMNRIIKGESIEMDNVIDNVSDKLLRDNERIRDIYNSEENDKSFFNMTLDQFDELKKGVQGIYDQIKRNSDRIKKYTEGATGDPKIFTNLVVYDKSEDSAETIDIVVVYPNGAVGIYKYEAINFYENSDTGEIKELSRTHIEANEVVLFKAKEALKKMYQLDNIDFAESRIVPINIQLKHKSKYTPNDNIGKGFAKIELGSNEDRLYLEQIPVARELITEDAPLSKSLNKMINLRSNLKHQLDSNPKDQQLRVHYNRIDKAIKDLQLNREAATVYNEVYNMYTQLNKLELEPSESPNYDYKDFNNYIMFADVFEGMSDNISDSEGGTILTDENKEKLGKITNMAQAIKTKATRKILDRLESTTGKDFTKDLIESGAISGVFKQLQEYDGEVFKRMAKLVEQNIEKIRQDFNRVHDIIYTKHKALEKWAKKNNISLFDAFKKIYNVDKRGLVSKYTSEYYQDLDEARKKRKLKWLQDNLILTPEREKRFNEERDIYFKFLERTYPDNIEEQDKLKLEWEKKFDINKYPSTALLNKKNPFPTLKENSKYYSEDWNELNKQKNKPLLDYYNQYIEFNQYFNDLVDRKISKGFVAELRQNTLDRVFQTGIGSAGNIWRQLKHSLEVREFDVSTRQIDPSTGKILPIIPLLYTDPVRDPLNEEEKKIIKENLQRDGFIEGSPVYNSEYQKRVSKQEYLKGAEYKNFDLTKSLLLFADSVFTNRHFTDTVEEIKAIQNLMKSGLIETKLTARSGNPLVNKLTGEYAKKIGLTKTDIDAFDNFVNTYWYGLELETKDFEFKGKSERDKDGNLISEGNKYSGTKLYYLLSKLTTMKALLLNVVAAGGNLLGLYSNYKIVAAEGIRFKEKHAKKAIRMLLGKNKKAIMLAKYFEPQSRRLSFQKASDLTASKVNKWLSTDRLMSLYRVPDDFFDEATLVAMLQNYGLDSNNDIQRLDKLPKGTISLFDKAEIKDGKVSLPGVSDNENNFIQFRRMVRTTATSIKGVTAEDNKNNTGKNILVKALTKFRNWIPGLAQARFKNIKFDEDMREFDVGRYRVVAGEFARSETFLDRVKSFYTLLGQIAINMPIINRLKGDLNLYKNNTNNYANKVYFETFLQKNEDLRGKVSFEDFQEIRAAKMAGFAKEMAMMITFFLLASLAKSLLPDDDEEYIQRFFAKNTYKILNRGLLELNFWTNPNTVYELSQSSVPDLGTLQDIYRWVGNTLDVTRDLVTEDKDSWIQKKGGRAVLEKNQRDKTPAFYRTLKIMPFAGNLVQFLDLFDDPVR
jgi:hypothetical protein